jgi:hypothetical protein
MRKPTAYRITVCVVLAAGCGDLPDPAPGPKPVAKNIATKSPSVVVKAAKSDNQPPPKAKRKSPPDRPLPKSHARPIRDIDQAEARAVKKLTAAINESLEIGPTLVVWILDRTPSSEEIVRDVAAAAQDYYFSPEMRALAQAEEQPLLTSVVAFDHEAQFVLEEPTGDTDKISVAFSGLSLSAAHRERPFTAVKQALEKYLPFRTKERRELMLIVVTDEAGDDPDVLDELVETTRRNAISVYAIGLPAPWGQRNPFATHPKAADDLVDDSSPTVGPESVLSERVDIDNWTAHYATRANTDLVDSGFGPFALERLCRASRGQFIALRPGLGYDDRSVNARTWPNGDELRFEEPVVSRYAPDYVSAADYQKLLNENKARAALVAAAKMPKVTIEGSPGSRFPKGAEAKMAKQLSAAQQFAASNAPRVDRLYEILAPGEADRSKLTSPRWQAQFDLALGRALANKARLDGYNSMIAALKRGKSFHNEDSKEWVLESADHFETESTIKRLADKARAFLQQVISDHPGTPWAKISEEELKLPLGWRWIEK